MATGLLSFSMLPRATTQGSIWLQTVADQEEGGYFPNPSYVYILTYNIIPYQDKMVVAHTSCLIK